MGTKCIGATHVKNMITIQQDVCDLLVGMGVVGVSFEAAKATPPPKGSSSFGRMFRSVGVGVVCNCIISL